MYFYLSKFLAPFLNILNFLIFFLIFLLFLRLKSNKKYIKYLINCSIILLMLISFFPIGKYGITYLEKDYISQNNIIKIDNILVLAGPENIGLTKITKKLNIRDGSERLIASVKLALENPNATIYFLGGDGALVKKFKFDEIDVAKIFYQDIGFDLQRVKFINSTRNTIENLQAFKNQNINNKFNILVTSAYHMKRSMLIAKKFNIDVVPYAVDFRMTAYLSELKEDKLSILNRITGFSILSNLTNFNIFFREIIGILAFKLFKSNVDKSKFLSMLIKTTGFLDSIIFSKVFLSGLLI